MDEGSVAPTIEVAADDWLAGLWARNRIGSAHTEKAYRRDLTVWASALGAPIGTLRVDTLQSDALERASGELAKHYEPSSRRRMYATLSGFTRWCVWKGYLANNPLEDAQLKIARSRGQQLPKHVPEPDLAKLLSAAAIEPTRSRARCPQRDRAILAVLIGTGVRSAELCGLRTGDVLESDPPFLHVRGKGGHQRRIPLDTDVMTRLSAWLDARDRQSERDPTFAAAASDALFVTTRGKPFTPPVLRNLILSLFTQAKVTPPEGAMIHGFRHTFAYRLVTAGVPLPVVQALLGHKSMATTSIYVRMTSEDSIRAIGRLDLAGLLNPTGRG